MEKEESLQEAIEDIEFRKETVVEVALQMASMIKESNLSPFEADCAIKLMERSLKVGLPDIPHN